jgi:hypothetical protein
VFVIPIDAHITFASSTCRAGETAKQSIVALLGTRVGMHGVGKKRRGPPRSTVELGGPRFQSVSVAIDECGDTGTAASISAE